MSAIWIVFILMIPVAIMTSVIDRKRSTAVKGTHQKYVATSAVIVCHLIESVLNIAMSVVLLNTGNTGDIFWAGLWSIFAVLSVRRAYKVFKSDDDNWFNKQFQKLKKGFKKAKENLQSIFSPTPVPGFG